MKYLKQLIGLLIIAFLFSSCVTANAPTRYQGRNLYKFNKTQRTVKKGKARGTRFYAMKHRSSYNHPAVPDWLRRQLRSRTWMEDIGAGQLYK